jgi:UDP-N-acetylglucosamine 3-dehydrogenase
MTKTRIVVVGYGRMGKAQLRVMRETPGFEVVAAVDPKAPVTPELGSVPLVRRLSDAPAFDAAVVATSTPQHFEVTRELIAMGKHVLVEKPITSTFAQARDLLEAAEKKDVRLAVGHVERFNPVIRKLREVIKGGWLGAPIHFSFTRVGGYPDSVTIGNNVILDLAVHDIDILRVLVGPVKLAHSMCHAVWKPGVLDTAEIFIAAKSGPSASVHVNWVTPTKIRTLRVTGTRGVCFVDYILQTCELMGGQLLSTVEPTLNNYESFRDLYRATDRIHFGVVKVEPLRAQAEQLYKYFTEGDIGELATGYDAATAVLIAERAMQVDSTVPAQGPSDGTSTRPGPVSGVPDLSTEWL